MTKTHFGKKVFQDKKTIVFTLKMKNGVLSNTMPTSKENISFGITIHPIITEKAAEQILTNLTFFF